MTHFLIIRFSSMGDIVLSTPVAAQLKMTYPDCKISFLTYKSFVSILEGVKEIDHIIGVDKGKGLSGIKNIVSEVQKAHEQNPIDLVIDHHGNTRSFLVRKFLNVPSISMNKRRLSRLLMTKFKIKTMDSLLPHALRHVSEWQGLLGYQFSQEALAQKLGRGEGVITLSSGKVGVKEKKITLLPAASFTPKRWPIDKFAELTKQILNDSSLNAYELHILAGPEDEYCKQLLHFKDSHPTRFFYWQGAKNLKQSIESISSSALVVGNDTGLMHVAESCGIPVVGIFGPTIESFGFKPYLAKSVTVSKKLWCRPCSLTGNKKCFRKEQYCFSEISSTEVLMAIKSRL